MKSIFPPKVTNQLLQEALTRHVGHGNAALVLHDDFSEITDALKDKRVSRSINVAREAPNALDSVPPSSTVIYACTQDDLGLPFVSYMHRTGRKYYPVWGAAPGVYAYSNSTARKVLETEFEFQKRNGFGKWDFGPSDFSNILQAIEITKHLPGCYVEIGCYRGSSAGVALRYFAETRRKMETFFLDVFDGFSYETSIQSSDAIWQGTHVTEGFNLVRDRLLAYNNDFSDLKITVQKNNIIYDQLPEKISELGICIANLDVDLHEAVYAGLKKLAPHVVKNGIIIVEDPGHTPLLVGAKYALERFLSENHGSNFIPISMQSGQTFLIKK
jgi:hypothetical protein